MIEDLLEDLTDEIFFNVSEDKTVMPNTFKRTRFSPARPKSLKFCITEKERNLTLQTRLSFNITSQHRAF